MREGVVRVESVWLDKPPDVYARLHRFLSPDEQQRAARFVFERDRHHFVVCRGLLRQTVGRLLDRDPAAIRFVYGPHGKPELRDGELAFNVSHSAGLALFAFSARGLLGVDVESVDRQVKAEELATRFFSRMETDDLLSLPVEQRQEAFLNCWTRKEAYIKAIGNGLHCPLDSFAVTLRPGEPAAMRWMDNGDRSAWSITALRPGPRYIAALATSYVPELECAFAAEPI